MAWPSVDWRGLQQIVDRMHEIPSRLEERHPCTAAPAVSSQQSATTSQPQQRVSRSNGCCRLSPTLRVCSRSSSTTGSDDEAQCNVQRRHGCGTHVWRAPRWVRGFAVHACSSCCARACHGSSRCAHVRAVVEVRSLRVQRVSQRRPAVHGAVLECRPPLDVAERR